MKDLHIHTIYSDGELSVEEVIDKVKEKNVDFFSITDHDTVIGNKVIIEKYLHKIDNVKFVSGIELSAKIETGKCHILGYNIDIDSVVLNKELNEIKEMNQYNLYLIINCLIDKFGINFKEEIIDTIFNKEGTINNVTISQALVDLGYSGDINEAFRKYVEPAKKITKNDKKEFSAYKCIKIIRDSGGIPVLAHNYQLKKNLLDLKNYIIDLKDHGLMGLECYHSGFDLVGINNSLKLAQELDLLVTGGSDYHGINVKPNIDIGCGKNNNLHIKKLSIENYLNGKYRY